MILDRIHTSMDDVWSKLDYTIFDSEAPISEHPPTSLKTETPLTAPEIVINREPATQPPDFLRQHIKQESMDDFEQLLDNANASFNIHKHTIREQTSRLTYAQSSSGISSMSSSSQSILPPNLLLEGEHNTEDSNAEQKVDEEDFYQTMLDEIRTDWLHFRPRTPDESDVLFDSDLLSSEFSVELQALAEQDSYHLDPIACLDSEDVYLSEPFAPDCFTTTPQHIPSQSRQNSSLRLKLDTSTSESELNVSGDSLSLSLHEESEQMLDNILQECQIDDIGALNQTSNFCNELLADDDLPQLDLVNVPERKGKRKLGYCSEYVKHGGKRSKSNRCQRVVGCSSFELLQAPPKDLFQTPEIKDIVKANDCFVPPIETKVEVDSEWKVCNQIFLLLIQITNLNYSLRILSMQPPQRLANLTKECARSPLPNCSRTTTFCNTGHQSARQQILRAFHSIRSLRPLETVLCLPAFSSSKRFSPFNLKTIRLC